MKNRMIVTLLTCLAAFQGAQAVTLDFNGTPGSTPVSMTLAHDVNFTITSSTNAMMMFVIDGLFAIPDVGMDFVSSFSQTLNFSINGGANNQVTRWSDNSNSVFGDMTAGDGYFFLFGSYDLVAGDIVTLHAGSMTSAATSDTGFNLGMDGDYDVFIINGMNGSTISENGVSVVPEPASVLTIAFGGLLISGYRRFFGRA